MGLFLLLVATVVFAAATLMVRFKLESFRAQLELQLEERFGAQLAMGSVSINGVQGLRIDDLEVSITAENGPTIVLKAPRALVNINLNDLLYGKIRIDRVVLDYARIRIERPLEANWYTPGAFDLEDMLRLKPTDTFRLTGKHCALEVRNVMDASRLDIDRFAFDISRLVDAEHLEANLEGDINNDRKKHVEVKLSMVSFEDFDLRIQTSRLTHDDLNVVLPSDRPLVTSGVTTPTLWINGRPDDTLLVSLHAPFEGIVVRDQPDFLEPSTGTLTLLATYSTRSSVLSVTHARAETEDLSGRLDGTISLAGKLPELDLRLVATRMPAQQILNYAVEGRLDEYGKVELTLNEPHELMLSLNGTTDDLVFGARATADSGHVDFVPTNPDLPHFSLDLGLIEGRWNSETESLEGTLSVTGGEVYFDQMDLVAKGVMGTVTLADSVVSMVPLNANITGNPFVGSFAYDISSNDGEIMLDGTISELEKSSLSDIFADTLLSGAVNIRGAFEKLGDRYIIDAVVDATQAQIEHAWWYAKPVGIGASGVVHAEFRHGESASIQVEGDIASSQISAQLHLTYAGAPEPTWKLQTASAVSDSLDVTVVGKCLKIPYKVSGGLGTDASFNWERGATDDSWSLTLLAKFDELVLLTIDDSAESPMICHGLEAGVTMANDPERVGLITLTASEAIMPRLGTTWLVPMTRDRSRDASASDRRWRYELKADNLDLPPWKARNFTATAYSDAEKSGFESFAGAIEDGLLQGSYESTKIDNVYRLSVNWTDVASRYFIEHLNYPPVLKGVMSGEIIYTLDRDDPNTLNGGGFFEFDEGKFSADFLYSLLEGRVESELITLPPSLDFSYLRADIGLNKDVVQMPILKLESEGIQLSGTGQFIRDGDMDFRIELAVEPKIAEKIPLLADNFNVQGYRLAQQDIKLAFQIDGPTFNPQGRLAEFPAASVTLLSGALEVTSEAIRIIDIPRRILIDILKIGGGILSASKREGRSSNSENRSQRKR